MKEISKKAQETKRKILTSAQRLFQKKGFEATSVREITEAAGCAKGTFYLYFETKLDLLRQMSDMLFKVFDEAIIHELSIFTDNPFAQIDSVFNNIQFYTQNIDIDLRLIHSAEILGLISENDIDNSTNIIISKISDFISKGIQKGFFRPLDPIMYGRIIFGIVHQLLESSMLKEYPADINTLKSELSIIIRKILEK